MLCAHGVLERTNFPPHRAVVEETDRAAVLDAITLILLLVGSRGPDPYPGAAISPHIRRSVMWITEPGVVCVQDVTHGCISCLLRG